MAKRKEDDAKRHLQNVLNQKKLQHEAVMKSMPKYCLVGFILCLVGLALFLVPWAEIYNTDIPGVEVTTNGFSFLAAAVTGDYTSTEAIYKDLAVPFNYYAESWCYRMGLATLAAGIALLIGLLVQLVTVLKKAYVLNFLAAVAGLLSGVSLLVVFFVGTTMKNSDILPIYCSGNPACSIHTYAFVPAIALLLMGIINIPAFISYTKAEKDWKKSQAEAEKAGL